MGEETVCMGAGIEVCFTNRKFVNTQQPMFKILADAHDFLNENASHALIQLSKSTPIGERPETEKKSVASLFRKAKATGRDNEWLGPLSSIERVFGEDAIDCDSCLIGSNFQ